MHTLNLLFHIHILRFVLVMCMCGCIHANVQMLCAIMNVEVHRILKTLYDLRQLGFGENVSCLTWVQVTKHDFFARAVHALNH